MANRHAFIKVDDYDKSPAANGVAHGHIATSWQELQSSGDGLPKGVSKSDAPFLPTPAANRRHDSAAA
jgi:hypothetical protein